MKREVLFDVSEETVSISFPCYFKMTEEYNNGCKEVTFWAFNDVDNVETIIASTEDDEVSVSYETDTSYITDNYDKDFFDDHTSIKGSEFNKFKNAYIGIVDKIKNS